MEVTLRFDFESLLPRPERMPPNGKEIILSYLKQEIRQYQAEQLLGWTRDQFNDYLATIVSVSRKEFGLATVSKEDLKGNIRSLTKIADEIDSANRNMRTPQITSSSSEAIREAILDLETLVV